MANSCRKKVDGSYPGGTKFGMIWLRFRKGRGNAAADRVLIVTFLHWDSVPIGVDFRGPTDESTNRTAMDSPGRFGGDAGAVGPQPVRIAHLRQRSVELGDE